MQVLVGNWWAFVIRGILAILFGVLTFVMPTMALLTLVFLFGFYAIADGVLAIAAAAFRRNGGGGGGGAPWWGLLIAGIIGILAGLIALFYPGMTAFVLLYIIAAWAVVTGILHIAAAIRLRKQITGEWVLAVTGVLAILLGVMLALFPGTGALAVVLWIGAFAVAYGIMLIALGLRLRAWDRSVEHHAHDIPPGMAPSH